MSKKGEKRKYQRHEPLLKRLSKVGSFTLFEAREVGISHPVLLRLVDKGKVIRLQRGLYVVPGSEEVGQKGDYILANHKFAGRCVIGGLTALSHYQLIDEIPTKIWLLVPPNVRTSDKKYRLIRTKKDLSVGVLDKGFYRITSIERSLIDALQFASKIGERVSKLAIIRALRNKQTSSQKLFEMAKQMAALSILDKEWQAILAGLAK